MGVLGAVALVTGMLGLVTGGDAGAVTGAASYGGFIDRGMTSTTWPVPVLPNGAAEGNRTFRVHLTNVTGATVGRGNGVGTILDDD